MSEAKDAGNDPSMDDILKSIRKIISDDDARAQLGRPPPAPSREASRPQVGRVDVLLLTNPIEEPASKPGVPPAQVTKMPQPAVQPPADGSLLAAAVAGAASSAFSRLNQVVQDSVPAPAASDPGPTVSAAGKTVEDLVKEMLRPMLKEWLDRNLASIVERYVEREIVRLTRR